MTGTNVEDFTPKHASTEKAPSNDVTVDAKSSDRLLQAEEVREKLGNISDMTLWRWLDDPDMGFPKPIYLRRRRFWRQSVLLAWIDERAAASCDPSGENTTRKA